jgi:predicted HTH transcriptional regulator
MKLADATSYIHALIAQGEHAEQDFKYEISDARKIARTLSAFANTHGGRLLIGVKDNGRIAGVRSEEEMYMIEAAAQLYCVPEVAISMTTYRVEGHTILIAEIAESQSKPVMARDENNKLWAYVRVADENILASPTHLYLWQQDRETQSSAITFTERESMVLDLLSREEECSLSRICRMTHISRYDVQQLLARFVHWGIVAMRYDGHHFVFRNVCE